MGTTILRIALFITCLADLFLPRAGIASVAVLERFGHQVIFPEKQTCCGQPMYNNGYHEDARHLACRMIGIFDDPTIDAVVSPSGSCVAMVREHFPELVAQTSPATRAAAKRLVAHTFDLGQFISKFHLDDLRNLNPKWVGTATYHYSCHYRGLGIQPHVIPNILTMINGLTYIPLDRADQCCGFGGTFSVTMPQISGSMSIEKATRIDATKADIVVCTDPGCTLNITGASSRINSTTRVISLAELLAESMGLMNATDSVVAEGR